MNTETPEICKIAVRRGDGDTIRHVPTELMTEELCMIAVQRNGMSLQNIPSYNQTNEICEMALKNNIHAMRNVPSEMITKELLDELIEDIKQVFSYFVKENENM